MRSVRQKGGVLLDLDDQIKDILDDNEFVSVGEFLRKWQQCLYLVSMDDIHSWIAITSLTLSEKIILVKLFVSRYFFDSRYAMCPDMSFYRCSRKKCEGSEQCTCSKTLNWFIDQCSSLK